MWKKLRIFWKKMVLEYRTVNRSPGIRVYSSVLAPRAYYLGGIALIFFLMNRQSGGANAKGNEFREKPREDDRPE